MTLTAHPIIRPVKGAALAPGLAEASTGGLACLFSAGSRAVEIMPFDEVALAQFLHFRVTEADDAARRSGWIGGRLYNRMTGQNAEYTQVSGRRLMQIFELAGLEVPKVIEMPQQYLVRMDIIRAALDRLKERLGLSPVAI